MSRVVITSAQREGACIHVHNASGINAAVHSAADPFESLRRRRALATVIESFLKAALLFHTTMISYIYDFFQLSFQLPNTADLLWRFWTVLGPAPFHTLPPIILSSFRR
ncbi:hypothetical protein ALC62_02334 [Cyphomyrmex costatus]|uniref:Uncharacterized protein n=1 Tax=Cyphomyrmex costatus TaxID=456900 RepID=A0A195D1F0_9HYME|nr:hypothetical protein ALC62_02334 [Cyphomyrmex costatus]